MEEDEEVVEVYEDEVKIKSVAQSYVAAQYDSHPELCRACAQPSKFMIDIFSDRGVQLRLKDKIDQHLPIQVRIDDILPLQMCTNCVLRLDAFHKMTEVCARADKKLRSTFNCPPHPLSRVDAGPSSSHQVTVAQATSNIKHENEESTSNYIDPGNVTDNDCGSKSDVENNQTTETFQQKRKKPSKPAYRCPICSDIIEGRLNLEFHISSVHKKYRCEDCHTLFDSAEELYWHKDKLHKNECGICDIAFANKRAMFDHFSSMHSDLQGFQCDKCDKAFPLEAMLAQHSRNHDSIKFQRSSGPYQCQICNKILKSYDSFRGHRLVHLPTSEKNRFLCSVCGRGYPTACKLRYHTRFHTGEKPYKCDKCPKAFRMLENLKLHARVHVVGRPYRCDYCESRFKHSRDLHTHRKERHLGIWRYKCRVCVKVYDSIEEVTAHYDTHTSEQISKFPFCKVKYILVSDHYCEQCNKYFYGSGALSAHNTRHRRSKKLHVKKGGPKTWTPTVKSDFMCEICGKYLCSKISLIIHLRTHMKEKPFTCSECGKGFITKFFLEDHIRTHTGEMPFTCEACGKNFFKKSSMNIHYKSVHLNLRPHECDICSKAFKTKCALNLHYRIHTGERPYECDICQKTFIQKPDMARHRMRHDPSDLSHYTTALPSTSSMEKAIKNATKNVMNRIKRSKSTESLSKRTTKIHPHEVNVKMENENSYDNLTIVQTGEEEYAICSNVPPADGHKVVDADVEFYVYK